MKLKEKAVKPSHVVSVGETYSITIDSDHKKIIEVVELIDDNGGDDNNDGANGDNCDNNDGATVNGSIR